MITRFDLDDLLTLTFDLQNLIRSSQGLLSTPSILSKLFKPFTRCRGNNIWLDDRTNGPMEQPKQMMLLQTVLGGKGIKTT